MASSAVEKSKEIIETFNDRAVSNTVVYLKLHCEILGCISNFVVKYWSAFQTGLIFVLFNSVYAAGDSVCLGIVQQLTILCVAPLILQPSTLAMSLF